MTDVFISYKAEEFDDANWVKQTLETNGISCWMAPMSIPGGSNYALEIPQAIRTSKVFVLILSEKSQLSKWVPRELDQAINEGKTILPFMLENCPLRDDFNFYLSNIQRYAAYENKAVAIERMINQIRAILGAANNTERAPVENVSSRGPVGIVGNEATAEPVRKGAPAEMAGAAKGAITDCQKTDSVHVSKPQKPAKTQETGVKEKKKRKLIPLFVTIGVVGSIAAAAVAVMVLAIGMIGSRVSLAGKKYNKSDSYITVKDAELSAEDIAALSKFKKLSGLYLTNCVIPTDSLDFIFQTVGYRVELINCGLTDGDLSKVDFKDVTVNAICLNENEGLTDLSGLSSLGERLQDLSFNGCSVADISFVEALTSLRTIAFDSNKVEDITALSKCVKLEKASVSDNSIKSLAALSACAKLEVLSADSNKLINLNGLESCILLEKLYAANNAITDISGIQNATLLSEVDFSANKVADISLLGKSKGSLQRLDLSDNEIDNIDALSECRLITELNISHNRIETLDALSGLTEITSFSASYNRLADITGLKSCEKLADVDLSNNWIADIGSLSLASSVNGVSLDVSHNSIASLNIPKVNYRYLSLFGNPVSDLSAVNGTTGRTLVFDYKADIDFASLANSDYYDYYVIDCPLDKQVEISDILGSYKVHFVSEQEFIKLNATK